MDPTHANQTVMSEVFGRLDAQHALPAIQAAVIQCGRTSSCVNQPSSLRSPAEAAGIPHAEVAIGVGEMMAWARGYLVDPLAELQALAGVRDAVSSRR